MAYYFFTTVTDTLKKEETYFKEAANCCHSYIELKNQTDKEIPEETTILKMLDNIQEKYTQKVVIDSVPRNESLNEKLVQLFNSAIVLSSEELCILAAEYKDVPETARLIYDHAKARGFELKNAYLSSNEKVDNFTNYINELKQVISGVSPAIDTDIDGLMQNYIDNINIMSKEVTVA